MPTFTTAVMRSDHDDEITALVRRKGGVKVNALPCAKYVRVIIIFITMFLQCSQKIAGAPKCKSKAENIKIAEKALDALDKKFKVRVLTKFSMSLYVAFVLKM